MRKTILIVGESKFYSLFHAMLKNEFAIKWAETYPDALDYVKERPIHLIFLPNKLKGESSFPFASKVRALDSRRANIPIVVLSSIISSDIVSTASKTGNCEIIRLPVEPMSFSLQIGSIILKNAHAYEKPDPVTGLAKKRFAEEQIADILADGKKGALFLVDVDHYSFASSGISLDALLKVRDVIQEKTTDDFIFAVASAGGFVVFAPGMKVRDDIENFGQKIIDDIRRHIKNEEAYVSVGMAVSDRHGNTYEDLFRSCDKGLTRARTKGKNAACFYQW
ncbi:MAG: diguanylate cyclase [Oscillospiraceae bacterium]|jgi:PleD family two-component response regulator|nr:diguanylate cyclase [Oscillospiraceae bacterium]